MHVAVLKLIKILHSDGRFTVNFAVDVDVALPGTVVRDTSTAYISTGLEDISTRITKDVALLQARLDAGSKVGQGLLQLLRQNSLALTLYLWQPQDFNLCKQRNTLLVERRIWPVRPR